MCIGKIIIDIVRHRPRDSCYGIILKKFIWLSCFKIQHVFLHYVILDINKIYFTSLVYPIAVPRPLCWYIKIIFNQFGVDLKTIKFSCHYHYVILLDIATVHCVTLCDRMIPHMLYIHSQPSCSDIYVYINAQIVIIMINAIFWDY